MANFTTYLGRDTRLPPIPRYRDPITGRIDGDAINREYDRRDFRTSYFRANPELTAQALSRMAPETAFSPERPPGAVGPEGDPSPNDQAWALAWIELGIPESGVLGSQNPSYTGPSGPVGFP